MRVLFALSVASLCVSLVACNKPSAPPTGSSAGADSEPGSDTNAGAGAGSAAPAAAAVVGNAEVGKAAPDFTLPDLDGNEVKLSSFAGKIVVLEWFNPKCPYVKNAHTNGALKSMAKNEMAKGVVWLAVNSGAPGKQGAGKEESKAGAEAFGMTHPILLDESGAVGRAYGATNTPHMYVIDPKGVLVYAGALDDTHGGEPEPGEKVVNYVEQALAAVREGKPVPTPQTKAWGCTVKYGS